MYDTESELLTYMYGYFVFHVILYDTTRMIETVLFSRSDEISCCHTVHDIQDNNLAVLCSLYDTVGGCQQNSRLNSV